MKKRSKTKSEATPRECVLALAANNLVDMRLGKRLKTVNEVAESTTIPSCKSIGVGRGQCLKYVAELCSSQGKKERKKYGTRHSNAVEHDHSTDIPNNSGLLSNPSSCITDNCKLVPNSKITLSKQKTNKRKRNISVESDKETVQLEIANFVTCSPLDKDLLAQFPVNSCLKEDSEMKNNVLGVSLPGGRNGATQESKMHDPAESADISLDFEVRHSRHSLKTTNICSPLQSDAKPVFAVDSKADFGLMENHDDDEADANVSSETKTARTYQRTSRIREGVKTYERRRKKGEDSPIINSKSNHEDASSLMLTLQNRIGNTCLNHSAETLFSHWSKDVNEKILVEGEGSLLRVVEDVPLEKVVDGSADLECIVMENERRMDKEHLHENIVAACLEKDMPLVDSLEEKFEQSKMPKPDDVMDMLGESGISHESKASGDEYGKISPEEAGSKHTIPSTSDFSKSKDSTAQVNKPSNFSLERSLNGSSRKTLIVLDLNGLLAEIVPESDVYRPDTIISGKAVFKRPFCDDFLQFCFTKFSVGLWSSKMKRNVQLILDFLMGDAQQKLLFCWDQSRCTETGFNTVENRKKPILVKELKKLWEKYEPNLPWERGEYSKTNTLLIDDSPYKALGNPPHTAIFPHPYCHTNEKDNSLGPGGDLRVYLEGLANAENVQNYVEENPFGQRPITEKNLSWRYYCKVIEAISSAPEDTHNQYSRANFQWRSNGEDTGNRYSRANFQQRNNGEDTGSRYSRADFRWRSKGEDTGDRYPRANFEWRSNREDTGNRYSRVNEDAGNRYSRVNEDAGNRYSRVDFQWQSNRDDTGNRFSRVNEDTGNRYSRVNFQWHSNREDTGDRYSRVNFHW